MDKIKIFLLSVSVVVLLLIAVVVGLAHLYVDKANGSEHYAQTYFNKLGIDYEFGRVRSGDRQLRYVHTGQKDSTKPLILFVHGAPGSWEAYKFFLADTDLRSMAQLISIDRLGYGESDYGQPALDIATHLSLIHI